MKKSPLNFDSFFQNVFIEHFISLTLILSLSFGTINVSATAPPVNYDRGIVINHNRASLKGFFISLNGTDISAILNEETINANKINRVTSQVSDQQLTNVVVKGKVTDKASGQPLAGVSIVVKGSSSGTSTDANGNYSITVPENGILIVSSVGYDNIEIPVKGQTVINISMEVSAKGLNAVVLVGYGSQKKVDVTGAIDVIDPDVLGKTTASSPLTALQGHAPGAYIQTSGAPGASPSIIIRGLSTLGNNSPLYIIDGVPTESGLDNVDANSIESIQILKDAAAGSIYGSRASNGVIIVQTKKGRGVSLTFDSRVTNQKYLNKIKVLNTIQRGQAYWQALINEGQDPNTHPLYDYEWSDDASGVPVLQKVIPIEWINQDLGIKSANTDWFKEVTRPGLILQNELTLSTGGASGGARLSVTQYHDKGIYIFNKFNKVNVTLNSDYKFNNNIKVGSSIIYTNSVNYPEHVSGDALTQQSIIPVHTVDGKGWGGPWGAGFEDWLQPVMEGTIASWDNTKINSLFGTGYLQIGILRNLIFKSTIGIEQLNSSYTEYDRPYESGFLHRTVASLAINNTNTFNWSLSNTLTYDLKLGKNSITVLGGTDLYKNTINTFNGFADDFAIDEKDYYQMDAAAGTQTVNGNETGYRLLSFFGKINYNYLDKYLLSATLRDDGSSRFGKENRFGLFPSVSVGWRMEKENFLKDIKVLDLLKPRYGYGVVGNQEIGNYASLGLYQALYGQDYTWHWDQSTSYDLNGADQGTLPSGFRRVQSGNDQLKWETTTENNYGLDFGFLNMAISGSFDYFVRKSKDILIQPPYLGAIGEGGSRWYNGASVANKGWEVSLQYKNVNSGFKDFSYEVSVNLGHFKDRITYLPPSVVKAYPGNVEQTILGHSQSAIFGYVADGLFQNQAEVDKAADQTGKGIGRIRYKDLNGDGVIDALDQKFIGDQLPGLIYGINLSISYKRWNISVFANGVTNESIYNSVKQNTDFIFSRAGINYGVRVLDAWTPQNNKSTIPALITTNNNNEYRSSTYFVESGSYLKLRNVEINYNFKPGSIKFFESLRIFAIGENLALIKSKSYTGPDPEAPNNRYGRPRNLTIGINFSL
jgi:TonB-linked SusC/RagA family outer membrane protein